MQSICNQRASGYLTTKEECHRKTTIQYASALINEKLDWSVHLYFWCSGAGACYLLAVYWTVKVTSLQEKVRKSPAFVIPPLPKNICSLYKSVFILTSCAIRKTRLITFFPKQSGFHVRDYLVSYLGELSREPFVPLRRRSSCRSACVNRWLDWFGTLMAHSLPPAVPTMHIKSIQ